MQFVAHKRRRPPAVIIVSLIDVLLVVLIFMMVTTTFKKEVPPALKINLPETKAAKAGATDAKPFIVIVATNSPYLYLDDRPVTLDRLANEMSAAVKKDPQVRVAIKADRRSPWGEVIKVLDVAKAANVAPDHVTAITEKVK
jgi:biopolymer transport protein ExbD